MKSLLVIVFSLSGIFLVQTNLTKISDAISSGDAEALRPYFDKSVEISIGDDFDFYPKNEAVTIVKNFFSSHTPAGYSQTHEGTSLGKDSRYVIGDLKTSSGSFRVYIYLNGLKGQEVIQELRFNRK
ncbi:MAG: DUF4783 domain-containing protein [Saprospiraceae bacterium]|nr:DUF4783 domain-containing protein [Saprospiraceae bacterium]